MKDITAITVHCNTPELYGRMYEAFRLLYPEMLLLVVDNSDTFTLESDDYTRVYQFKENIGHGRGLDFALRNTETRYALIMDTDTVILKDPLTEMIALMDDYTYGVGCITEVGRDGYDFGAYKKHKIPIPYLHPFFALINVREYKWYKPFVHHGAPWYKAAIDLYDRGLTDKIKHFNGLRAWDKEASGRMMPTQTEYVSHDFGGTRRKLKSMGRDEIKLGWIL